MLKFTITIFITSLVLLFIPRIAVEQDWIRSSPSYGVEIISVLALITMAVFYLLQRIQKADPQRVVHFYLLTIVIKMGVGSAFILIVIFVDIANAKLNAAFFLFSYIFYTALEIGFLVKKYYSNQKEI